MRIAVKSAVVLIVHAILFLVEGIDKGVALAQDYPEWFLNQGSISSTNLAIGYAHTSFYSDSATAKAFQDACQNFALLHCSYVTGAEAFWNREDKTTWMGSTYQEQTDSTIATWAVHSFKALARFESKDIVLVAAGLPELESKLDSTQLVVSSLSQQPLWVEQLPGDSSFIYSLGQSPGYYYEKSSWLNAEARCRLQLCKSISIKLQSMQKYSGIIEQIYHEEVKSCLMNIQIMARWRDKDKNIFYVLMRMPR